MQLFCAQWVFPTADRMIRDGGAVVDGHLIIAVGEREVMASQFPRAQVIDLKNCVLLPGLINAHTHFELSNLAGQVSAEGSFVDWIGRLVGARRRAGMSSAAAARKAIREVIDGACRHSIAAGTTCVGDISHEHQAWRAMSDSPIRKMCFAEVLDITAQWPKAADYLDRCMTDTPNDDALLRLGFSPHAPYSVAPGLYALTAQKAARRHVPMTTHLAESKDEIEFLQTAGGPWRQYIERIGKWDGSFRCPKTTPIRYFLSLDLADQPMLLAHVNYITDDEISLLAKTPHSVAYCPRAHHFFAHPPHRFREMLTAGINVCLGTDSLACNTTLSILDEMRFLHKNHPDVVATTILNMATRNAARALRWDDQIGTIEPGKFADLIAVPLEPAPTTQSANPLANLLESERQPSFVMIHGRSLM